MTETTKTTKQFEIHSEPVCDTPAVMGLTLAGRFDAEALHLVLEKIDEARGTGFCRFVIDLSEVTFIGSAGIGIFLSLAEEMKSTGGGMVLAGVPDPIVRIFEVLNVLEFLEIRETIDTALEALREIEQATEARG